MLWTLYYDCMEKSFFYTTWLFSCRLVKICVVRSLVWGENCGRLHLEKRMMKIKKIILKDSHRKKCKTNYLHAHLLHIQLHFSLSRYV